MKPIIVLGSGLAGYSVVRELRKLNPDISISLLTRDNGDYYSKPMLSNAFAQHKDTLGLVITRADDIARQLGIELLTHTEVRAIDRASKQLDSSAGMLEYDKLVLALGADAIRIPLQGDSANAVLSVNDLVDYAQLRAALATAKSVAIMGAGLIGCEFANDLVHAGYAVSVIEPGVYPLSSLMPEAAGAQLQSALAKLGVDWHFGTSVQRVTREAPGYALTLGNGSQVRADVMLSAVGLHPRTQLARGAGLMVNHGIVVDSGLRSSDPAIYALGDCAEISGKVQPFVLPIMLAARVLARVLNGEYAQLVFPAMPVVVKTPAHPISVAPVARDAQGNWQLFETGRGVKMGFIDALNNLTGFVLTGEYAVERNEMAKKLIG